MEVFSKLVPVGQTHVWGTEDKSESSPSWMFCQCPASCPSPCPPWELSAF